MASYSWNGGSGGWGTIANWAGGIPNSSTADATIAAAGTYTVKLESGKTYTVDSVTLANATAILDVLGTLDLAGSLALLNLSSGTLDVAGLISGGTVSLNNGNTVIAAGGTINAAQLVQGGSGYINLNGSSLTLGGTSTLQGYELGSGDLVVSGQSTLTDNVDFEAGATLVDKGIISLASGADFGNGGTLATVLSIAAGGVLDDTVVNVALSNSGTFSITNAGLFEVTETAASYLNVYANFTNASTGTIYLAAGDDVSLLQGQDTLAGTITGPGDLYIGQGATASLQASLTLGAGVVTVSDGNTDVILESSRTFGGTFDELNGANLNLNAHNLTLTGNGTLNAYIGGGTVVIAGTLDSDFFLASGSEELVTGTAIDATGNDRLNYDGGTAASVLSIASTGTYDITQINGEIDYNGTGGTIINAGLFENIEQTPTFTYNGDTDSYLNVYANFTNASTGTILLGTADDISLIYGTNDLAGTITGPGDLYLGVTTTLEAGLVLNNGRYLTLNGGGTEIYLRGNRLFNQQYFVDQNGATLQLGGYSATLGGGGTLAAYVAGPGTLDITGTLYNTGDLTSGVTEVLSGAEIQNGYTYLDNDNGTAATVLSVTTGGTYDITADGAIYNGNNNGTGTGTIVNAGLFEKTGYDNYTNIYADFTNASTGTIFLAAEDDISLITGTSSLAGTIAGPGYIYFGQGETASLGASLVVKGVSDFTASDGNTQVILGGNETYGSATLFTDQNSADIQLNGNTLTLGHAQFSNAYISGNGELIIAGSADINGLNVIGTATILDQGVITQDGYDELGTTNTAQVTLSIATHGTYDLINDTYINPQNGGPIVNAGLFEKTAASGISDVYSVFTNTSTGTIDAASGTIRLDSGGTIAGTLAGAGEINVSGGTLALAVGTIGVTAFYLASGELVLQNNVADTHYFTQNGGTLDLNGFTLSLGTAGDYLANGYLVGPGTVSESARVDVNNYYLTGGAELKDTGTITQDGYLQIGTFGADTGELSIASTGIYNIVNDNNIGSDGAVAPVIDNSGLFEKTAATGTSNIYTIFNNNAGATLAVDRGYIQLNGGGTLNGTLTGGGALYLDQYYASQTYTLATTAVVSVATLNLNGATLDITGSRDFAGTFDESGGLLNLGSFVLTLSAAAALDNAYLTGTGTLDLTAATELRNYYETGGVTLLDASTITEDGNLQLGLAATDSGALSIASGATFDIINDSYINVNGTAVVTNAGLFEKTADNGFTEVEATFNNTGVLDVARGTIDLSGGGTLAGTLEGAGTLELGDGAFVLQSAAVLSVANLEDYSASVTLAGNRNFAGNFNQYYGNATLALAGHTLTLSGDASLAGGATAAGAGTLAVTGFADINGYNLTGGAVLLDTGTVTMDGAFQIGETSTDTATLSVASTGTFDILNDNYIYEDGTVTVVNSGLFEKTGSATGRSYVQGAFTNSATIAVTSGILEEQALTNDGTVTIGADATDQTDYDVTALSGDAGKFVLGGGATLYEADGMAASQTVLFSGTANLVELGTGGAFAGAITSFAAGDTIDLIGTTVNGFNYAGGKLTLTENTTIVTTIAVSTVAGAGTFSLVQDSGGNGTDILLGTPGSITQPGSITTDTLSVPNGTTTADFNNAADWGAGSIANASNTAVDHGAGTITESGQNIIYGIDFNNTGLVFDQTGGALTVIDGGGIDSGILNQSAGATIIDKAGELNLPIEGTIAGTLAGTGEIEIGGNPGNGQSAVDLAAGAVLSVATLALDNVLLGGNLGYAGVFAGPGSDFLGLNGFTLDLTGQDFFAPTYEYSVSGPGEMIVAGTAETALLYIDSSATVDVTGTLTSDQDLEVGNSGTDTGALIIAAGGTVALSDSTNVYGSGQTTLVVSGLLVRNGDYGTSYVQSVNLTESSAGVIDAAHGTIEIDSDAGTLAGTLEGNFVNLSSDAFTIAAGAVLSVGTLQINGGNTITLGGGRTYAGNFDMSGGSGGTLALGGFGLDLTGVAELDGEYVAGSGTLTVAGSADVSGMQLVGSETLLVTGTVTEDGNLALGQAATDTTALQIGAGAVYDLITDNSIYIANGTDTVINGGLLEKTADFGVSYIGPSFTNGSSGTLDVAAGTIDLQGGGLLNGVLEGAGQLELQNNNGTFTLASTAVLTVATLNVNENLILEHAETFTGDLIQTNNVDLNGFNLSLTGTASLDSSVQGPGTLTVTKGDISGLYLYDDAVMVVKGTVTQDGGFSMSNSSTDSTVLSIASGAVYDLLTDNSINNNGTAVINNAGLFEKAGDYGTSYIYSTFDNTGTLDVVRGFLNFQSGGSLSGTVEGSVDGSVAQGAIIEAGGTLTIGASATVAIASISVTGGDLSFGANLAYAGSLSGTGGSLSLNGHTISLAAPYLGGFYLTGPGTLDVSGTATLNGLGEISGVVLVDKGTIIQDGGYQIGYSASDTSVLSIASGATFDIITDNYVGADGGTASNAGLFEKTADNGYSGIQAGLVNTGTINVSLGTLAFQGGGTTLGGTLKGAGEIQLDTTNLTLTSTVVTVATLDINSYPTLGANLTYGGFFDLNYGNTFTIASHSLVLSGTAALVGGFQGPGSVTVSGSAYVQTLDLYGGTTLVDTGTINQIDELRFSLNDETSDTLSIAATGIYDIQDDSNFHNYNNAGSAEVAINAGLLEKTGDAGLSELEVTLTNTGTLLVSSGTLQVDAISNLAGGTLTGGSYVVDAGLLGPTLALAGSPIAVDAAAITLSGAGTELLAGGTLIEQSLLSVASGGILAILDGRDFAAVNTITDAGLIDLNGTFSAPALAIAAGGTLAGQGVVAGAITNNGLIDASGTTLTIDNAIAGTGSLLIGAGDELLLAAGVASGENITFGGSHSVLGLAAPGAVLGTLVSLAPSDTIDLTSLAATAATISGGDLIVTLTGGGTLAYALAGANALDRAATHTDGGTGTDIVIFREATAGTITPATTNFGEHHAGVSLVDTYTIGNTAVVDPYSENLDGQMGAITGGITDSGSFAGLAPGAKNSTSLHATLVTTTGGVVSGTATVNLETDGSGVSGDGNGTLALPSETVTLTGTIFNYATASAAAPNPINFGEHHVGVTLTQDLTLANLAVAGAYSENLDGKFTGTSGAISANGTISEILAGKASTASLQISLHAGTAGVQSGTTTLALTSDGKNIDSLGTTALAAQTITASGTLFNYATAASLAPNPIAFGEHHVGATLTQDLTLANSAAAGVYSENLDGKFSGTSSDLTGSGSVSELAAGATSASGLIVTLHSGAAGTFSGAGTLALTSDGAGIDTLGTTALASQTVTVTGTLFNYATDNVTPARSSFGEHHVGDTLSQFLTITNSAAAGIYSENLDVSVSGTSSNLTGSGTISELAAGAANSGALNLVLNSGTAGTHTGTATLASISDGSGIDTLGTTTLGAQTVSVTSTLFNYATASTASPEPVNFGIVHVGQTISHFITISNKAAAGAYSENLDTSFTGTTGSFTTSGASSELVAGKTSTAALDVTLQTGAAGTFSGTTTLGLTSDGLGIDTLGTTALGSQTVALIGTVNNYATATIETISGPGVLSGSGTSFHLNLGSVAKGSADLVENIGILNSALGPADNLSGTFVVTGSSEIGHTGFGTFSGIGAGAADTAPTVTLSTGTVGTFTETIYVEAKGYNASGYAGSLAHETLVVTGTVTAAGAVVAAAPASDAAVIPAARPEMAFAAPRASAAAPIPATGHAAAALLPELHTVTATGGAADWMRLAAAKYAARFAAAVPLHGLAPEEAAHGALLVDARDQPHYPNAAPINERLMV